MTKLTLDQYKALPPCEQKLLRRLACGMVPPPGFECPYDLVALRQLLEEEAARTLTIPFVKASEDPNERWD